VTSHDNMSKLQFWNHASHLPYALKALDRANNPDLDLAIHT